MRTSRAAALLAAATVAVAAFAGCTGGDGVAPGATPSADAAPPTAAQTTMPPAPGTGAPPDTGLPDPCALVTAAELGTATGVDFGDGVAAPEISEAGEVACLWQPEDSPVPILTLALSTGASTPADLALRASQSRDRVGTVHGATDVWSSPAGHVVQMAVGDYYVVLEVTWYDGDTSAITLPAAALVAARLGSP